jgi:hypothetical protein
MVALYLHSPIRLHSVVLNYWSTGIISLKLLPWIVIELTIQAITGLQYVKRKSIPVTGRGGLSSCEPSRLPNFVDSRLTDGGEVVSLTRRRDALKRLILISVRGWVDLRALVRLEGLGQLRIPVVSSGIEPATFRLVAFVEVRNSSFDRRVSLMVVNLMGPQVRRFLSREV